MSEMARETLDLQYDIYQRHRVVAALLRNLCEGGGRVLDVGAGPERLLERFLGAGWEVVRADTGHFEDAGVVPLAPGAPLPFADGMFHAVVALDVLEHVPAAERAALVAECGRVSRGLAIVGTPLGTAAVRQAEARARALHVGITGQPNRFLEEHAQRGLPTPEELHRDCAALGAHRVEVDNVMLDTWLPALAFDWLLAQDAARAADKARFNARLNRSLPPRRAGVAHYRRLMVGGPAAISREAVERVMASLEQDSSPLEVDLELLLTAAEQLAVTAGGLRQGLVQKDAYIAMLERSLPERLLGLGRRLLGGPRPGRS